MPLYTAPMGRTVLMLRQTTAQTVLGDGTNAIMSWQAEDLDVFNAWDSSAPTKFQPPVPGWYLLNGGVCFAGNATGYRQAFWRKNNANVNGGSGIIIANGALTSIVFARPMAIQFNGSTDYVELAATQNAGSGTNINTVVTGATMPTMTAIYTGP